MELSQTYQIKSTPFIRRMVSTSTKNGELQRLKQEYERIKNFNERTIEKQMRHARLRRLYRVIEIIKENQPERIRARTKTEEHMRAEQINKARQLGQEYSRQNAVKMEQNFFRPVPSKHHLKFSFEPHNPKDELARRNRSSRRIAYGNTCSRINREQIILNAGRRINTSQCTEPPDPVEEKRERLSKRIKYGNHWSTLNLEQLQKVKNNNQDQNNDIAQLRWLDSIRSVHSAQWMQITEPQTDTLDDGMTTAFEEMDDESTEQNDHDLKPSVLVQVPDAVEGSTELEAILTSEDTVLGETLETITPMREDTKLQKVGRYVLDALRKPFVLSKRKSSSTLFQEALDVPEINTPSQQYNPAIPSTNSIGRVDVEDIIEEDDDEQSELHHASNSRNLTIVFKQSDNDLQSSTSRFVLPPSSADETLTPDELVLSCERYIDEKNNQFIMHTYDSSILNAYEKIMDLRSKILPQVTSPMSDKDQLLSLGKVRNLRSIFEN